ncbi:hypothetical protein BC629DRAFT_1727008 [Irpex lacteus]|nr:hypothetical protein BC629DRAFT_1727008 [Irpex lacteus]
MNGLPTDFAVDLPLRPTGFVSCSVRLATEPAHMSYLERPPQQQYSDLRNIASTAGGETDALLTLGGVACESLHLSSALRATEGNPTKEIYASALQDDTASGYIPDCTDPERICVVERGALCWNLRYHDVRAWSPIAKLLLGWACLKMEMWGSGMSNPIIATRRQQDQYGPPLASVIALIPATHTHHMQELDSRQA